MQVSPETPVLLAGTKADMVRSSSGNAFVDIWSTLSTSKTSYRHTMGARLLWTTFKTVALNETEPSTPRATGGNEDQDFGVRVAKTETETKISVARPVAGFRDGNVRGTKDRHGTAAVRSTLSALLDAGRPHHARRYATPLADELAAFAGTRPPATSCLLCARGRGVSATAGHDVQRRTYPKSRVGGIGFVDALHATAAVQAGVHGATINGHAYPPGGDDVVSGTGRGVCDRVGSWLRRRGRVGPWSRRLLRPLPARRRLLRGRSVQSPDNLVAAELLTRSRTWCEVTSPSLRPVYGISIPKSFAS